MGDHLMKAMILHSFQKKFNFELISVALINATVQVTFHTQWMLQHCYSITSEIHMG